ncbi:MAG: hypothetical protein ACE5IY_10715 [bacterium]
MKKNMLFGFLLSTGFALLVPIVPTLAAKEVKASAPFESTGEGPVYYVDYASFQGLDNKTYVEFYIQVGYRDLQFYKNGKRFEAGYDLDFALLDEQGKSVESYQTDDRFQVDTFAQTLSRQKARILLLGFTVEPGSYTVKSTLKDRETRKSTRIHQPCSVQNFTSKDLQISDIQLSQKIEPGEDGQPYVKNRRYIEPNAVRIFAHGLADIYVYFEIYNLIEPDLKESTNYLAHFIIKDQDGKQFAHLKRSHPKPGVTSAHSIRLPVSHFLNGRYSLIVRIEDEDTGRVTESSKAFTVLDRPLSMSEFSPENL